MVGSTPPRVVIRPRSLVVLDTRFSPWISSCKAYQQEHYQKNKKAYKARAKQKKDENRRRLFEYLRGKTCVDCGEDRIPALQFDHVNGDKDRPIATMVADRCCWERILAEIEKCEIRCASCHAVRTAKEHGWYADLM